MSPESETASSPAPTVHGQLAAPTRAYDRYDFALHDVEVDGMRMHYVDEGSGETILMLHGNPTWSYLYRHIIHGLSDSYRCVAPDHIGFGLSDKPPGVDLSMRAHIARLDRFVTALDLRDITLMVQDWGGIIGLGWAVQHKDRIKRLVIMNTTGFVPDPAQVGRMRPLPWGLGLLWLFKLPVLGELFVQGLNGFARYLIPFANHDTARLSPEVMRGYLDVYPTWASRRAHLESVRQVPMTPLSPTWSLLQETDQLLTGWDVRTQLIWGMRDPVFVPWFLHGFEHRLPNHAPSLQLTGAGHFLQDDMPEPIIERTRAFMQEVSRSEESEGHAPHERDPERDEQQRQQRVGAAHQGRPPAERLRLG